MHIACRHVQRGQAMKTRLGARYSPALFNIATDALINETLRLARYRLPLPHVKLAELLAHLPGQNPKSAGDFLTRVDAETLYAMLRDALDAGGGPAEALRAACRGIVGDLDGTVPCTPDSVADAEWASRLGRALAAGQRAGRGVGAQAVTLADLPKPRVPWEIVLRRLVTKSVTVEPRPSFARPALRWLALDADTSVPGRPAPAHVPGIERQKGVPRIVVCLDVSGSISGRLLQRFGAEIAGIGRRTGAELHLIVFDDGIRLDRRLEGFDLVSELEGLSFKGRGGTSFVEPVAAALARDPSAIVVLTDLCGPFGPAPARVPVFWACPNVMPPAPPFGRVVPLLD